MKHFSFFLLILLLLLVTTSCDSLFDSSQRGTFSRAEPSGRTVQKPFSDEVESSAIVEDSLADDSSEEEIVLPLTQKLVIPEGYTLARIAILLEELGYGSVEEFIDLTQTNDYSSFPLLADVSENPNRCFKLEGFLFPDTYEVYIEESFDSIIHRLLNNTERKIDDTLRQAIAESGYTTLEILSLASVIEKEAFGPAEMGRISSVLHNRLDSGMKLQCDVTIAYVEGAIKPFIDGDIDRYNEYYNTYKTAGIPVGPICNPSIDAIRAAVSPLATDYLFFLTDEDGKFYYADTYAKHRLNAAEAGIPVG